MEDKFGIAELLMGGDWLPYQEACLAAKDRQGKTPAMYLDGKEKKLLREWLNNVRERGRHQVAKGN